MMRRENKTGVLPSAFYSLLSLGIPQGGAINANRMAEMTQATEHYRHKFLVPKR